MGTRYPGVRLSAGARGRRLSPAAREFKRVVEGRCEVCGTEGLVRRHHLIPEQLLRRESADEFDLRVGLWVGAFDWVCKCHRNHHAANPKMPLALIRPETWLFAAEIFGSVDRAHAIIDRYYQT